MKLTPRAGGERIEAGPGTYLHKERVMPANPNHPDGVSPVPTENAEIGASSASSDCEGAFDAIAADLYNLASMILGEGERSMQLLETVVARADESACNEPDGGVNSARKWVIESAI